VQGPEFKLQYCQREKNTYWTPAMCHGTGDVSLNHLNHEKGTGENWTIILQALRTGKVNANYYYGIDNYIKDVYLNL
jgi:hypothetical protein